MHPKAVSALFTIAFLCIALPAVSQPEGLTLDRAYELGRSGSEAVRLRELALQKTRLAMDEARSRAWPHVDLQTSASYLPKPSQGALVPANSLSISIPNPLQPQKPTTLTFPSTDTYLGAQQHQYFSLTASLSQPLFTWGKIRNAIDAAALVVDAAGTELTAQRRDIEREVHRAYFSDLLAQDSLDILKRIADTAAEIVADRQKSFDQGTINREAVLQARSNLASIQSRLAEAEQSRETALESLGILTGLDPSSIVLADDFRIDFPSLDERALSAKALAASTDLASSRTRVSQAQKKVAIERGGSMLLPDVALGVSLNVSGQEDLGYTSSQLSLNGTWDWNLAISLGVKISVFDGFSSFKRIGQAEKDLEMAATRLSQQQKLERLGVRKAIDAAIKADAGLKEKQAAADYAEERLRNATASFDNGLASREDMHGADILAGSARLDLLLSLYLREEALADIARVTGERI